MGMLTSVAPRGNHRRPGVVLAAAAVVVMAAPALAEISPVVFNIRATNANGTAEWSGMLDAGQFNPDGSYSWSLAAPRELRLPSGELVGTLTQGTTFIVEDPLVSLGFAVQAGALDTTFQITSALLSFPALNPAEGLASGSITATDLTSNGVTLTGLQPGGHMVTTQYNGFVPGGTTFANLIPGPLSNPSGGGTLSQSDAFPGVGFTPIAGSVTDISLQYFFTLSAGDIASGTAVFVVVPGPGTAAGLLGLAALAIGRRRR